MDSINDKNSWINLINKSVHTMDDKDIGDVFAINHEYVIIKQGFLAVHYYYIPISKVKGEKGNILVLKISEKQVKEKYEKDKSPDPLQYYVMDYPYYNKYHRSLSLVHKKNNFDRSSSQIRSKKNQKK